MYNIQTILPTIIYLHTSNLSMQSLNQILTTKSEKNMDVPTFCEL
jgi:hypothetical protein